MKRISLIILVVAFMYILCGCSIPDYDYESEFYTVEKDIAFIYFEQRAITNSYGGIKDYDKYIVYGVVNEDGSVTTEEDYCEPAWYFEDHSLNVSEKSYIKYTYEKEICTDPSNNNEIVWTSDYSLVDFDFYISSEMMNRIGSNIVN